jgi:seryl-tRNA synthetase
MNERLTELLNEKVNRKGSIDAIKADIKRLKKWLNDEQERLQKADDELDEHLKNDGTGPYQEFLRNEEEPQYSRREEQQ